MLYLLIFLLLRSGIGVEGGSLHVDATTVHDCARHGVAVFGDLGGAGGTAMLSGCVLQGNRGNGALVRDGARLEMADSSAVGNAGWGVLVGADGAATLQSVRFAGNGLGGVSVDELGSCSGCSPETLVG